MILKQAAEEWLKRKGRLCPKARRDLERTVARWVARWGTLECADLLPANVIVYEGERDDGKRAGGSLNWERTYLKGFCRFCRAMGWTPMTWDPMSEWSPRKEERRKEPTFYTREEKLALAREIRADLRAFTWFMAVSGLRESSVRRLIWAWLRDGVLQIPAWAVKNKWPIRLALPEEVLKALPPRGALDAPIFGDVPEWPQTVWRLFRKAARKLGLKGSPKSLRASFANQLMAEGAPIGLVMRWGGWRDMKTVLGYYVTDVPDEETRRWLSKLA